MKRKELTYSFKKKRNYKLITPCCNSSNKDGKFVNYEELPENYGYCHSCGKATLPKPVYVDDDQKEFIWDEINNMYIPFNRSITYENKHTFTKKQQKQQKQQRFIDEDIIWKYFHITPENNLLKYLRSTYDNSKVDLAKEWYALGTTKDGGTIFWQINQDLKVQKNKICYYDLNGKRKNRFLSQYKNEHGYLSCLFGAHLLPSMEKSKETVVLVESEKTAIVGFINLPKYTWLAYGGLNQLTDQKLNALIGYRVLIIPDISGRAVRVMEEKIPKMKRLGIRASIWDMTDGKTDEQLKEEGIYNDDLEDFFRKIATRTTTSISIVDS